MRIEEAVALLANVYYVGEAVHGEIVLRCTFLRGIFPSRLVVKGKLWVPTLEQLAGEWQTYGDMIQEIKRFNLEPGSISQAAEEVMRTGGWLESEHGTLLIPDENGVLHSASENGMLIGEWRPRAVEIIDTKWKVVGPMREWKKEEEHNE